MPSPSKNFEGSFNSLDWLSEAQFSEITNHRINDPELAYKLAQKRVRREALTLDGFLNVLAVDHPARFVTEVADNPLAMGDRREYLARMVALLSENLIDGVMASMDILEELLVIQQIKNDNFLDGKVMIASLNRGGLAGAAWELDDPVTGATPLSVKSWQFDGIKVLFRMDLYQADSLKTMTAMTQMITEANQCQLPVFLEPLPVTSCSGQIPMNVKVQKKADLLTKLVGVATALGDSSRYIWLKLPYCENFEMVAKSTTCPIVFLGGDVSGEPDGFINMVKAGLASGSNVRGTMVGRNVMFPDHGNPLKVAQQVSELVHPGAEKIATEEPELLTV